MSEIKSVQCANFTAALGETFRFSLVREMREIYKAPGCAPEPRDIPNTLEDLQATVGGYIETVTIASDAVIICNEEGRLHGLPHNCRVFGVDFVGPILIAGVDEDEFTDLDSGAMGALLEGWGRSIKNAET